MKSLAALVFTGIFFYCQGEISENRNVPYYNNPVEKVLTVGGEDLPEDYLLVLQLPYLLLKVNDAGDIILYDEHSLKIYDKNGNPKKIIGGQGQGPGEFSGTQMGMWRSPSGFLTLMDNGMTFSTFGPDNSFLKRDNFRNSETYKRLKEMLSVERFLPERIMYSDENTRVIEGTYGVYFIAYEKNDKLEVLCRLSEDEPKKFYGRSYQLHFGGLHWEMLPENKFVYSRPGLKTEITNGSAFYNLHIVSLETFEENIITVPYEPVAIPDSIYNQIYDPYEKTTSQLQDKAKQHKYYDPFYKMIADGNYLYLFTGYERYRNAKTADVIDLETGRHISTVYFSFDPLCIKDMHAYMITQSEDGFPKIEKYRVNPAVYGK